MKKKITIKERIHSYLINHLWLKYIVDYGVALIMALLSATIFSFGFKTFLSPSDPHMTHIISGGISGISQIINLIVQISHLQVLDHFFPYIHDILERLL